MDKVLRALARKRSRRLRPRLRAETSLYLYLDEDNVRKDKIKSGDISFNLEGSPFCWVDLFSAGPATKISWTSSYPETGVLGAELATVAKGKGSL